jgi:hypothetical protein
MNNIGDASVTDTPITPAAGLLSQSQDPAQSWRVRTPAGMVTVQLNDGNLWTVTFECFSRSTNRSLATALAEATGVHPDAPWLRRLVSRLDARKIPCRHASEGNIHAAEHSSRSLSA